MENLIFLDISYLNESILNLVLEIKKHTVLNKLPIILCCIDKSEFTRKFANENNLRILLKPLKQLKLTNALLESLKLGSYQKEKISTSFVYDKNLANKVPLKILIAEDNKINQIVITKILNTFGYQVDIAENGIKTLELITKKQYDLVLLDIQMPVLDGLEVAKKLQSKSKKIKPPILIALTAQTLTEDHSYYLEMGISDILKKPIMAEMIYSMIIKWGGN